MLRLDRRPAEEPRSRAVRRSASLRAGVEATGRKATSGEPALIADGKITPAGLAALGRTGLVKGSRRQGLFSPSSHRSRTDAETGQGSLGRATIVSVRRNSACTWPGSWTPSGRRHASGGSVSNDWAGRGQTARDEVGRWQDAIIASGVFTKVQRHSESHRSLRGRGGIGRERPHAEVCPRPAVPRQGEGVSRGRPTRRDWRLAEPSWASASRC